MRGFAASFVNNRSLVCNAPESSIVTCYLKFMLTFSISMNFFQIFVFLTMIKSEINVFLVAAFYNKFILLTPSALPIPPYIYIKRKKKKRKKERKQENE